MAIDFEIPPEAKAIREKVRQWVHDECIPAEKELDGKPLKSNATLASDATNAVRRTAILAVDVSNSMGNGGKFTAAKQAAQLFLNGSSSNDDATKLNHAKGGQVADTSITQSQE